MLTNWGNILVFVMGEGRGSRCITGGEYRRGDRAGGLRHGQACALAWRLGELVSLISLLL